MIRRTSRRPAARVGRAVLLVAMCATLAGAPAVAVAAEATTSPRTAEDTAKGTALVKRFFNLLKASDEDGLDELLSPAFQLQGADGGYLDKQEFVADPPDVQSFDLSNVRVTRAGPVIVARYDVEAVVTIDGTPQSRDPAPRLSVFARGKKGWQLVAHANFNVPEETPPE